MTERERRDIELLIEECDISIACAATPCSAARVMRWRQQLRRKLRPWWLRWLP